MPILEMNTEIQTTTTNPISILRIAIIDKITNINIVKNRQSKFPKIIKQNTGRENRSNPNSIKILKRKKV